VAWASVRPGVAEPHERHEERREQPREGQDAAGPSPATSRDKVVRVREERNLDEQHVIARSMRTGREPRSRVDVIADQGGALPVQRDPIGRSSAGAIAPGPVDSGHHTTPPASSPAMSARRRPVMPRPARGSPRTPDHQQTADAATRRATRRARPRARAPESTDAPYSRRAPREAFEAAASPTAGTRCLRGVATEFLSGPVARRGDTAPTHVRSGRIRQLLAVAKVTVLADEVGGEQNAGITLARPALSTSARNRERATRRRRGRHPMRSPRRWASRPLCCGLARWPAGAHEDQQQREIADASEALGRFTASPSRCAAALR